MAVFLLMNVFYSFSTIHRRYFYWEIGHNVHPQGISGILHYTATNKGIAFEMTENDSQKWLLV